MLQYLKQKLWNDSWVEEYALSKIFSGVTVLGLAMADPSVHDALEHVGLSPNVFLFLTLLGAVSMLAMPHRHDDA